MESAAIWSSASVTRWPSVLRRERRAPGGSVATGVRWSRLSRTSGVPQESCPAAGLPARPPPPVGLPNRLERFILWVKVSPAEPAAHAPGAADRVLPCSSTRQIGSGPGAGRRCVVGPTDCRGRNTVAVASAGRVLLCACRLPCTDPGPRTARTVMAGLGSAAASHAGHGFRSDLLGAPDPRPTGLATRSFTNLKRPSVTLALDAAGVACADEGDS